MRAREERQDHKERRGDEIRAGSSGTIRHRGEDPRERERERRSDEGRERKYEGANRLKELCGT